MLQAHDGAFRRRAPQLILVAVAGYELRGLLSAMAAAVRLLSTGSSTLLWCGALVALLLGGALLQVARGLNRVATVPRWVLGVLGAWCAAASTLLVLLSADGALSGHGVPSLALGRAGPVTDVLTLLGLGAGLGVARETGRWLLCHSLSLELDPMPAASGEPPRRRHRRVHAPRQPALRAGWPDRGPPQHLSVPAI